MKSILKTVVAGAVAMVGLLSAAAAEEAFSLPGEHVFPEGIAVSSDGTAYVGSIYDGKIFRHVAGGPVEEFVASGDNGLVSAIGLLLDEEKGTLWVCSSDPGVGRLTGRAKPALLAFNAETGAAKARYELPDGGFCNDMAFDDDGALYVTDSLSPRILRLAPESDALKVWFEDARFQTGDFGLNGLDFTDANTLYVVTYHNARLFRLNLDNAGGVAGVAEVETDRPLALGDGMKALDRNRLLLVEGSGRLTEIDLHADMAKTKTVATGFSFPTTVSIRGDEAWLVEGQLDKLFVEDGPRPARLPFLVHRVNLMEVGS